MELVLTVLVVVLLIVLSIAFFLLVIGGLLYSVYRAIGQRPIALIRASGVPAERRAGCKGA
jgi:hypothetical protein